MLLFRFIVSLFAIACITVISKPVFSIESHAVVLMYHRFGEDIFPTTSIKTEQFIQQLDFIEENGFIVWPVQKIISSLQNKKTIPDKVIAITIDDAYLSVYQIAYPLMLERNMPFTLFVSSKGIDEHYSSYVNWDQINDMVEHGVTLGNHSLQHLYLLQHKDKVASEVILNEKRIKEMTGVKTTLFAYPYGEFDVDIMKQVASLNYVAFGQQSGPIGERSDFRSLSRFPVSEQYSDLNELSNKLKSLPMPIVEVKPETVVTDLSVPVMMVTVDDKLKAKSTLQCFASGQGRANISWLGENRFMVKAKKPMVLRRSRYNCTIRHKSGRYYWYSKFWLRPEINE